MINCSHNDFSIVGDITVINRNIKLGHNVTIYPDVMFFDQVTSNLATKTSVLYC